MSPLSPASDSRSGCLSSHIPLTSPGRNNHEMHEGGSPATYPGGQMRKESPPLTGIFRAFCAFPKGEFCVTLPVVHPAAYGLRALQPPRTAGGSCEERG